MSEVQVVLDRVGATYDVGERVTGVVALFCESATSHRGIELNASGFLRVEGSERAHPAFREAPSDVALQQLLSVNLKLAEPGKLPAGETVIPFSFPLSSGSKRNPLVETYHGVYVKVEYTVHATVSFLFSVKNTEPVTLLVSAPGQSAPSAEELLMDRGRDFSLNSANVRTSRKVQGARVPSFEIDGAVARYYNDIDIPLSGYVRIVNCNLPITSVEIQLIRSENVARGEEIGRENTEVQNIQIGDGDVPRGVVIPMHMMFPKWYTCAALIGNDVKVEFEINLVVTLEGHTQITQNLPIRLYRSHPEEVA
jgi:hypothetical protein